VATEQIAINFRGCFILPHPAEVTHVHAKFHQVKLFVDVHELSSSERKLAMMLKITHRTLPGKETKVQQVG